ncbi:MAG: hypothetical protein DMD91_20675, partial [Candidatus Rokuibacteriota bacterium]
MRPGRWLVLATILSGLAMSSDPAADQPMTGLAPFEIFADGFRDPRGIAVNANGSVFVADRKAGTVTRIANHTRTVIASGLQRPIGLAFDPAGHLLIAEEKAGRVVRVEANGQRSPVIVNVKQPRWLAVHENGTVFVSARRPTRDGDSERDDDDDSTELSMILALTPERQLRVFADNFKGLQGLALNHTVLFAATRGRKGDARVDGMIFEIPILADGSAGAPVAMGGTRQVEDPIAIARDRLGALFVTASQLKLQKDDARGGVAKVHADGHVSLFAQRLKEPQGLALDTLGHLYVADGDAGRVLRFLAPGAPTLSTPGFTNQSPLTITGETEANAEADLFLNETTTPVTVTADQAGAFTAQLTLTLNHANKVEAFVTSHAGDGLTGAPAEATIVHDDVAPSLSFLAPPAGAYVRQLVNVQARAADAGSGVNAITLTVDGHSLVATLVPTPPAASVTATAIWNTTTFGDGGHTLGASATDRAGNGTRTTRVVIVDNTPPDTQITSGPSGEIAVNSVTFAFTGTDNLTPTTNLAFAWRLDGSAFTSFGFATTTTLGGLAEGRHTFEVKTRDLAGNEDLTPATAAFTVTPRVPAPTITGFSPTAGRLGDPVTITGTNFGPTPTGNQVTIGGIAASVSSATPTQLVVRVPAGASTGRLAVTTTGGTAQSASPFTVIRLTALAVTPGRATLPIGAAQPFRSVATFSDQRTSDVTSFLSWASSDPNRVTVSSAGLSQGVALGTATITGTLDSLSAAATVQVIADSGGGPLPPDPSAVAPPLDRTVATTLAQATAFLFTGSNPVQTGVAPGTIELKRAAVVRGTVRGRDGFPIPGVTVSVLNHSEFGRTLTRPDGMFDMAVNGGGQLTINYARSGLLSAQRQVDVPWQDYVAAPDVVMIALDPQVTAVTLLGATTIQLARGSAVTDADGARQATLLFAPGTQATMTLPGGGTQPLSTVSVRATEYTVGATGSKAMPAELPANSLYTYAVEFSLDEALAAGAMGVQFSQPVVTYVENFLGLPVGTTIPSGSYDRALGQWVGSSNGKIIKVLSVSGGVADVDTDGDAVSDNLLGLSTAELQQLATLYPSGTGLWRVPVTHFSPYDYNFGPGLPPEAVPPTVAFAHAVQTPCETCNQAGASNIVTQYQTLGETVALTGTPFTLHYQSDRVPGRLAADALEIPLSEASVPAPLKRIDLEVVVAGRRFTQSFPPAPNQTFTFQWDGKDAYGRTPQGSLTYQVGVGYVYDLVYSSTQRWGANGSTPPLTPRQRRIEGTRAQGLGGWSLSAHHAYDPLSHTLYLGTGGQREADTLPKIITTVFQGNSFTVPNRVAAGPDGTVYMASQDNRIWRLIPGQDSPQIFAGNGTAGDGGDGGPAIQAQLTQPDGLAVGPDGNVYISLPFSFRIRKVDPNGIITTFAGTGTFGYNGDGIPATQATLSGPRGAAVGPDGSVYFADSVNANVVRRIGPDGIITTVAGIVGSFGYSGDGGPATQATLRNPWDVAVARDGTLYIVDLTNAMVRRVGVDGIIQAVTQNGFFCQIPPYAGDGGPAIDAHTGARGVTVGPDGTVYVAGSSPTAGGCCCEGPPSVGVYQIDPRGIIRRVAGTGVQGFSGDGGPATQALLNSPTAVAVSPDGSLHIADAGNLRTRRVAPPLPGLGVSDFTLASEDGSELYTFNSVGKHLRTLDALTGAVKYQFGYNDSGLLTSVTGLAGQITTIERDNSGNPTAIVAPGGQRTTLSMEANGFLASLSNPAGDTVALTYTADGLLTTQTNARGLTSQYTHDALGRLSRDTNPAGGFFAVSRTESATGFTVNLATALNRVTSYRTETLPSGARHQVNTDAAGLSTDVVINADGSRTVTAPDGTVTTTIPGPDPRFGMQAPITKSLSVRLPTGLTSTLTTTRTATLSNASDPLSLTTQTDQLVINGRTYTSVFDQSAKTLTTTTPAGRTSAVTLDAQGRVVQEQVTGLEPVAYSYDTQGRLNTITQGTGTNARTSTLSYDTKNQLTSVQDPLLRSVGFAYDPAGRIITQTLPDTRTIGYSYDGNGNVTSITPPGRPAHAFSYTPVDLESNYDPPDAGFSPRNTQYTYNLDPQLTLVARPDGQTLSLDYDAGGRLSSLTLPGNLGTTYSYDATKGTLTSIATPDSTLSYTYFGSLLNTTTWAGTVAGSVSRNYDTNFRIITQSVNGVDTIAFAYDNDSLLTSAGDLTISRSAQNGLISGTTLGAIADSRSYSTFGELSNYTANANGSPVFSVTYIRDKLGRITQKTEMIGGITDTLVYTYDTAGRLTDVNLNGAATAHYTYDSNGNRLSKTTPTRTELGLYDEQDRLTQYANTTLTYTANGELLTKTAGGQTTSYEYDVLGNLRKVVQPTGTVIEYVIDGQNRRVGKKVNGVFMQGFLYQNQLNPVAELDGAGNVAARFVYG